jgi:hypothetical protein
MDTVSSAPLRSLKSLALLVLPFPRSLLSPLFFEVRLAALRARWLVSPARRLERRRLLARRSLRLHIGCGRNIVPGWLNIDVEAFPGVDLRYDMRRRFPFADESVARIFCEHLVMGLDYHADLPQFLSECHRVLEPDGVARFVAGNMAIYCRRYVEQGPAARAGRAIGFMADGEMLPEVDGVPDGWNVFDTRLEAINLVFRMNGHHRYAYDPETLAAALRRAGFSDIRPQTFGVSSVDDLALDRPDHRPESFYLEAVKTDRAPRRPSTA